MLFRVHWTSKTWSTEEEEKKIESVKQKLKCKELQTRNKRQVTGCTFLEKICSWGFKADLATKPHGHQQQMRTVLRLLWKPIPWCDAQNIYTLPRYKLFLKLEFLYWITKIFNVRSLHSGENSFRLRMHMHFKNYIVSNKKHISRHLHIKIIYKKTPQFSSRPASHVKILESTQ